MASELGSPLLAAAVGLILLTTSPAAQQRPAPVVGRVEIGVPITARRPSAAYPSRAIAAPALAPTSELRHVVVYLRNAKPQAVSPVQVAIRQLNERFNPRVVAVTVGSEVEFPNDDSIYHNVFSLSRAKNFNLGRYPRGPPGGSVSTNLASSRCSAKSIHT